MITFKKSGNWQLYWGAMPLPSGAEALGIVTHEAGAGALIRLANGNYVQGNAGGIRSLPQAGVEQALQLSAAATALGKKGGSAGTHLQNKARAANSKNAGRKPGSKNKPKCTIARERVIVEKEKSK